MEENEIITVLGENEEKIELQLIDTIEIEENRYVLLAPLDDEENAYVYKIAFDDQNRKNYELVEDDKEFDKVLEKYEESFE